MADMTSHRWLIPRLMKVNPHLTMRNAQGWLSSIINSNEFLFLRQDHSAALAQCIRSFILDPIPVVQERFVFAEEEKYIDEASAFYDDFGRWAKGMGCKNILVNENSDVPMILIRDRLGLVIDVTRYLARLP
jgi:hypothetical protein